MLWPADSDTNWRKSAICCGFIDIYLTTNFRGKDNTDYKGEDGSFMVLYAFFCNCIGCTPFYL